MNFPDLSQISWQPWLPASWIGALAALLIIAAIIAYGRESSAGRWRAALLGGLRLGLIGWLTVLMLGPSAATDEPLVGKPTLLILLDRSASMLTPDMGRQSRWDYLMQNWLTPQQLRALESGFDVSLYTFDQQPQSHARFLPQDPHAPFGDQSLYHRSIGQLLRQLPGAAMLILGDGHDTQQDDPADLIAAAAAAGSTLHTVAVGTNYVAPGFSLVALPVQEWLLPNEAGQVLVQLRQVGLDRGRLAIGLRGPGPAIKTDLDFNGQPARTLTLDLPRFTRPGTYEFQITAQVSAEGLKTPGQTQSVFVEVRDRPIRVLMLEGEPYWDTRHIARALRGDPQVELVQVTRIGPKKTQTLTTRIAPNPSPQPAQEFRDDDVILLGRGVEHLLTPQAAESLARHIASGKGHLVFTRGRPYNPDTPAGQAIAQRLGPLEPLTWGPLPPAFAQPASLSLTPIGQSHPLLTPLVTRLTWAALPSLSLLHQGRSVKPATVLLANLPVADKTQAPAIAAMNYGSGKVIALLAEGWWQWAMASPNNAVATETFWRHTVRWLALGEADSGKGWQLRLGRSVLPADETQLIELSHAGQPDSKPQAPKLTLIAADGTRQTPVLEPQEDSGRRWITRPRVQQPGAWTARLEAPTGPAIERRFSVYDPQTERMHSEARPQFLRRLAEQTGGLFFPGDQPADLARRFLQLDQARTITPPPQRIPLGGWMLAATLLWLTVEWIGRRKAGLR